MNWAQFTRPATCTSRHILGFVLMSVIAICGLANCGGPRTFEDYWREKRVRIMSASEDAPAVRLEFSADFPEGFDGTGLTSTVRQELVSGFRAAGINVLDSDQPVADRDFKKALVSIQLNPRCRTHYSIDELADRWNPDPSLPRYRPKESGAGKNVCSGAEMRVVLSASYRGEMVDDRITAGVNPPKEVRFDAEPPYDKVLQRWVKNCRTWFDKVRQGQGGR